MTRSVGLSEIMLVNAINVTTECSAKELDRITRNGLGLTDGLPIEAVTPQRSRRLTQVCSFELTQRLQPYGVDHCRRLWRVGAASVVVPFRASMPWAAAALVGT